jgi:hypothetical protein
MNLVRLVFFSSSDALFVSVCHRTLLCAFFLFCSDPLLFYAAGWVVRGGVVGVCWKVEGRE